MGTDPLLEDSDGDGVSDYLEHKIGTDPHDDGEVPTQDEIDDVFD